MAIGTAKHFDAADASGLSSLRLTSMNEDPLSPDGRPTESLPLLPRPPIRQMRPAQLV